ncbi:MAG: DUF374 domain-containing protein [Bacteriovoracaceae bacterium]|jgi:lysophospholipid acyltransferase (LPLAT)-like uncharacterized protein|nr:DUF374 domain-containing protein [Bacteriovoracaceae bacterium]
MKQKIIGIIAGLIFWAYKFTLRFDLQFENEGDRPLLKKMLKTKKPDHDSKYILAFFHQDELCMLPFFIGKQLSMLVSHSKDGEIMATALKTQGHTPVRGSSSKGAVAGLIACIRKVKEGYPNAMAVDGPRGPIYKVKDGVIAISNKTNTPILPMRAHPVKAKIFEKSWNKAKLPMPFSKVVLKVGAIKSYEKEELENCLINL